MSSTAKKLAGITLLLALLGAGAYLVLQRGWGEPQEKERFMSFLKVLPGEWTVESVNAHGDRIEVKGLAGFFSVSGHKASLYAAEAVLGGFSFQAAETAGMAQLAEVLEFKDMTLDFTGANAAGEAGQRFLMAQSHLKNIRGDLGTLLSLIRSDAPFPRVYEAALTFTAQRVELKDAKASFPQHLDSSEVKTAIGFFSADNAGLLAFRNAECRDIAVGISQGESLTIEQMDIAEFASPDFSAIIKTLKRKLEPSEGAALEAPAASQIEAARDIAIRDDQGVALTTGQITTSGAADPDSGAIGGTGSPEPPKDVLLETFAALRDRPLVIKGLVIRNLAGSPASGAFVKVERAALADFQLPNLEKIRSAKAQSRPEGETAPGSAEGLSALPMTMEGLEITGVSFAEGTSEVEIKRMGLGGYEFVVFDLLLKRLADSALDNGADRKNAFKSLSIYPPSVRGVVLEGLTRRKDQKTQLRVGRLALDLAGWADFDLVPSKENGTSESAGSPSSGSFVAILEGFALDDFAFDPGFLKMSVKRVTLGALRRPYHEALVDGESEEFGKAISTALKRQPLVLEGFVVDSLAIEDNIGLTYGLSGSLGLKEMTLDGSLAPDRLAGRFTLHELALPDSLLREIDPEFQAFRDLHGKPLLLSHTSDSVISLEDRKLRIVGNEWNLKLKDLASVAANLDMTLFLGNAAYLWEALSESGPEAVLLKKSRIVLEDEALVETVLQTQLRQTQSVQGGTEMTTEALRGTIAQLLMLEAASVPDSNLAQILEGLAKLARAPGRLSIAVTMEEPVRVDELPGRVESFGDVPGMCLTVDYDPAK